MKQKNQHKKPAPNQHKQAQTIAPQTDFLTMLAGNIRLQAGIIFLFAFLLYSNSLFLEYALDDITVINNNKYTVKGFGGFGGILSKDTFAGFYGENMNKLQGGRYRPLSLLAFAIEHQFFGLNAFVFHLFNVLYYSLLCALIFLTLRKMFASYKTSTPWYLSIPFIAALLYAANPLHTEVVANIKGRDEIFSMLGAVAALYFSFSYVEKQKNSTLLLSGLCFLLGLMSKENAITFIAIVPLSLYVFTNSTMKEYTATLFPLIMAAFIFILIRYAAIGLLLGGNAEKELLNNPFVNASIADKYATIFFVLWKYIYLLFFPFVLTHDYYPHYIPIISWSDYRAYFPFVLYILLFAYALKQIKAKDIPAYTILFYLITLSIVTNIVISVGTFMNERFLFMPSLAFSIFAAFLVVTPLRNGIKNNKQYAFIASSIVLILLTAYSIRTFTRTPVWKNDFTLATHDVHTSTTSAKCNSYAAVEYVLEAQKPGVDTVVEMEYFRKATVYAKRAIELHPKYNVPYIYCGNAYVFLSELDSALPMYIKGLEVAPRSKDMIFNLSVLSSRAVIKKDYNLAIRVHEELIKQLPDTMQYKIDLAKIYLEQNEVDKAMNYLNTLLSLYPLNDRVYALIGQIYGQRKNDLSTAITYLEKAYSLNNKNLSTIDDLSTAYGIAGKIQQSIAMSERALQLDPAHVKAYIDMSMGYTALGQKQKAQECMAKAQELTAKAAQPK